ncbi:MAG: hypothetical protein LBM77_04245 [Spirochaetaceae bacterium]|jgi:hypothetical protein|nr:hypothetical protein [Spirochaetaceae bacterium]
MKRPYAYGFSVFVLVIFLVACSEPGYTPQAEDQPEDTGPVASGLEGNVTGSYGQTDGPLGSPSKVYFLQLEGQSESPHTYEFYINQDLLSEGAYVLNEDEITFCPTDGSDSFCGTVSETCIAFPEGIYTDTINQGACTLDREALSTEETKQKVLADSANNKEIAGANYVVDYCLFNSGGVGRTFWTQGSEMDNGYEGKLAWCALFWNGEGERPGKCRFAWAPMQDFFIGVASFTMEVGDTGIIHTGHDGSIAEIWEWTEDGFISSGPLPPDIYVYTRNKVGDQTQWWKTYPYMWQSNGKTYNFSFGWEWQNNPPS